MEKSSVIKICRLDDKQLLSVAAIANCGCQKRKKKTECNTADVLLTKRVNFYIETTQLIAVCKSVINIILNNDEQQLQSMVSASNSFPSLVEQCRALHSSHSRRGLEEFFDDPKNWGEQQVKSGAPWTAKQLRTKSNEDLHKLWYVLLKEKNMLLTLEQESKRQAVPMPSPERLKKVERSMKRLDSVVNERTEALRLLQTGVQNERPGEWRKNCLGQAIW
ncbi:RM47 protein, partial [Polypterus senegalus]